MFHYEVQVTWRARARGVLALSHTSVLTGMSHDSEKSRKMMEGDAQDHLSANAVSLRSLGPPIWKTGWG